ncbi:MAG: Mov34/MPN/PAD-1 family protein [Acidiferrobacterales bacterium]
MKKSIVLTRALSNKLLTLAQKSPENEICGIVSGKDNILDKCYPVKNIALDQKTRFDMEPRQLLETMRLIRENKETFKAIYHSHPATVAYPSHKDIQQAAYENICYLIISLGTKGILELRAYDFYNESPDKKGVREIELSLQG